MLRLAAGVSGLILMGCYDPEEDFERFEFRCNRAIGSENICVERVVSTACPDPCTFPNSADIPGTFFISISSGIPTAELFATMQQVEVLDAVDQPDGSITITMQSVAVQACDPSRPTESNPGTPDDFGDPREFTIMPDATLELPLGEANVAADGNPVIPAPIRSDVTLRTCVCQEDTNFLCGSTSGELFEPVAQPLNGTFGMTRTSMHGEVPDPRFLDCDLTEAAPIAEYPVCTAQ